jgi:DNA-binding Lrp family transcriptional regulator
MPKNSIKGKKQDEIKILNELRKNANKSINDIAEKCGFSRQKVWRMINNIEKNHIIWGYTAIVDEEKIDKKYFTLLMRRSNKTVTKEIINHITKREISDKVKKIGVEFTDSFLTHGRYDWIIHFTAKNLNDAKKVVELYKELYEGFLSEINLLEKMFTVVSNGITNPEIKRLNDFFSV